GVALSLANPGVILARRKAGAFAIAMAERIWCTFLDVVLIFGGNVVVRVENWQKAAYPDRADMIPEQQSTGRNASNRLTTRPFFS
ncbi:MAG: hypothetical protein WCO77_11050, partial [bacterium]